MAYDLGVGATSSSSSTFCASHNNNRILALIDMDCFYVQVEERDDPTLKGKPAAVVQYNAWKGGGIIAVNYEARAKGVTRHGRGEDAKAACPEITLVKVPELRGKADLTKYRNAGHEVIKVLCEFCKTVERASVDEAYLDLTELVEAKLQAVMDGNSNVKDPIQALKNMNMEFLEGCFVVPSSSDGEEGSSDHSAVSWMRELMKGEMMTDLQDIKLLLGAELVGEMRKAVFEKTTFRCSAGIAHNKVMAKLACGINKPNKQTIIPHSSVPELFRKTKVSKVRNLGGKLGDVLVEQLKCEFMGDLLKFTEKELMTQLGSKCGSWVYSIARGFDDEVVTPRQLPKSIGCNKMFNGPEALANREKVKHWIIQLSAEVVDRLEKDLAANKRRAKSLTLHVKFESDVNTCHISKSCGTHVHYNAAKMAADAMAVMEKLYDANGFQPVVNLGLIASKFEQEDDISNCSKIDTFFKKGEPTPSSSSATATKCDLSAEPCSSKTATTPSNQKPPTNTAGEKPKGFFNRNPSPRKKNPIFGSVSSPFKASPKKVKVDGATSAIAPNYRPTASKDSKELSSSTSASTSTSKAPAELINVDTKSSSNSAAAEASSDAFKSFSKECERCHKSFPVWEISCHMDWHMARDLQREINGLPPASVPPRSPPQTRSSAKRPGPSNKTSSKSKSKRGRTTKGASKGESGMKTLDNYFTQGSNK